MREHIHKILNFFEGILFRVFENFPELINSGTNLVYFLFEKIDMFFHYLYFFLSDFFFLIIYIYTGVNGLSVCYNFLLFNFYKNYFWYFKKLPHKYGWRRKRKRYHLDVTLHPMIFSREIAFIFFYFLVILGVLYILIFLFRPSQKFRFFEANKRLHSRIEDYFFYTEGKISYVLPPLDWLTKLNMFFIRTKGGFVLAVYYYFYIMWIHKFIYRLVKGKRLLMAEYSLYQKEVEFKKKFKVDFGSYEKHLLENVRKATVQDTYKKDDIGDSLRFLHFSRIFGSDLPERDRFILFPKSFYLDYGSSNFKIVESINNLFDRGFFFKGFRIWNYREGAFIWLNAGAKQGFKERVVTFRPYFSKMYDLAPKLHYIYLSKKAALYDRFIGCYDGF